MREQVRELGIDVAGFVPQRHLEHLGIVGLTMEQSGSRGQEQTARRASIASGYTLWRNPDDRSDPVNLRAVDEETRRRWQLAEALPHPPWRKRMIERLRYPMLVDAVRTNWTAPGAEQVELAEELARHVNHLLNNQYRDSDVPRPRAEGGHRADVVSRDDAEHGHPVEIDGVTCDGILLDGNPHVTGLGARLDEQRTLTAVVDREHLALLRLAFLSQAPVSP
ncbi:hypothetical protein ACFOYW_00365 [Gryllotalpicola reticulitermitis]|uniref:Uncharacterized protein n=1 Tax=Gryllotalpicola reticulitermitis TaxID=1184153 RepID=A0ABV8Q3X8_9MICO